MEAVDEFSDTWMIEMGRQMGMNVKGNAPFGCGIRLCGDGKTTDGYLWYSIHEDSFIVTQCNFVFLRQCHLTMPLTVPYIALRLDQANYLPPGKIVSFMEEKCLESSTKMEAGSRVKYSEVMYFPAYYRKHLGTCFSRLKDRPAEILKNMSKNHNWPGEMLQILSAIAECTATGSAAEFYMTAKAYELMARLLEMGSVRAPQNETDYYGILTVIHYLDQNLATDIRQKELVRISNMSGTKLKVLFRQFTGQSITEYIIGKRADQAAKLLVETDWPIEQIAGAVGFGTATGFATSFKKQMKISPSAYRRQMAFQCVYNPSEKENLTFFNKKPIRS